MKKYSWKFEGRKINLIHIFHHTCPFVTCRNCGQLSLLHICFIRQEKDFSENRIVGEWNGFCATLWQYLPISSEFSKKKIKLSHGHYIRLAIDRRHHLIFGHAWFGHIFFLVKHFLLKYIYILKRWNTDISSEYNREKKKECRIFGKCVIWYLLHWYIDRNAIKAALAVKWAHRKIN